MRDKARQGQGLNGPGASARAGGLPYVETAHGVRYATLPPAFVKSGAGEPDVELAALGKSLDRVLCRATSALSI